MNAIQQAFTLKLEKLLNYTKKKKKQSAGAVFFAADPTLLFTAFIVSQENQSHLDG